MWWFEWKMMRPLYPCEPMGGRIRAGGQVWPLISCHVAPITFRHFQPVVLIRLGLKQPPQPLLWTWDWDHSVPPPGGEVLWWVVWMLSWRMFPDTVILWSTKCPNSRVLHVFKGSYQERFSCCKKVSKVFPSISRSLGTTWDSVSKNATHCILVYNICFL